jgi:Flp pilus assembly protein TadD
MSTRRILQAINAFLFILVIGVPLFYLPASVFPYNVPKTAFFHGAVEIIFFLWLTLTIADKKYRQYRPRMTPLAWAVAAFLAILTLTAFAGVDPVRSFFSTEGRAFGVIAWYHLAALALVVSALWREIPWKKLWYASFGASLAMVGIALIQLKVPTLLLASDGMGGRPGATFGNPTFLAGYLLVNAFMAGYWLMTQMQKQKDKNALSEAVKGAPASERAFLSFCFCICVIGIFITQTRGDILGLFAGVLVLLFLFAIKPPGLPWRLVSQKSFYAILLACLVIVGGTIWFTRANPVWDNVPGINRLKDISFSGARSDLIPREIALSAAWKGFLERPLTGFGLENFNVVFNEHYDPRALEFGYAESDFDKPHDVPLEMLDAGGIGLLLAYLAMLVCLVYEAWKSEKILGQTIAALVAAYFVRSLVFFDTLGPALMLFLVMGFVDGGWKMKNENRELRIENRKKNVYTGFLSPSVLCSLFSVLVLLLIYFLNITAVSAAYHQYLGDQEIGSNPSQAIADFHAAVDGWSPYQEEFTRDYTNTLAQAYSYEPGSVPQTEMTAAIARMEAVSMAHPNDAYNHYLLTDIYNLAYNPGDSYLAKAEQQAQEALALSPNRQEIYFYLARTKSLEGDIAGAFAEAKQALDLDPNVADSHFYYGMLAFADGKPDIGYAEVKTAIAMGRSWHDFYEPRIAADYFADSGHLSEAINLYEAALALRPGDLESEIKLGVAYFVSGDRADASKYLRDAASRFNLSQSPAYAQLKPILDALGIR